ncbi:DUF222 domain-containing protein [Kutzneria sp. CA-103260]|uniref:DUF222 domain-containing protein n=1 Tax=Kutzneria sp. CA-103260 TaxID=2802641 RepID=UPI001BADF693|nr:DUF222 domain-containing protein [Kutzneria sp. CA-103260]QUQ66359.1 hypothetical protein JJ691_40860 [Kutzneria sp. CA-103260]
MEDLAREMESMEPSGAMLDFFLGADLTSLTPELQTTATICLRKIKAFADHALLSILQCVEDTTELAMAIHEPEQSVVRQKDQAEALVRLPRLADLVRRGELDLRRLQVVDERIVHLARPDLVAQVEDALVDIAPRLTRTQLARLTTKLVAEADPLGYDQRRQKAREDRRVEFIPLPDGMAQLRLTLPAIDARAAYELLVQDARSLAKDDRTTDQKRADAFLDRFLGYGVDRKVKVHVTISMETLMGLTEDPALLDGYGPIAADAARELAMHGPWNGLLLDEYRHAAAIGTHTYRPNAETRAFSTLRDGGTCSAPGCISPIRELDHTVPWPQGKTNATQLKGYCAHHHRVKHGKCGNYTVTLDSDGTLHWVTPQGRHYTTQPHQY